MPIRITGLNSGLDTEALVSELVSAYRKKTEKYTKAQTKLSWKQDAWKELNTKINKFYSSVRSLKYTSAYNSKKATISDSTKATVTAKSGVATGTYDLKINQVAKSGYLTGAKLNDKITENSTLSELGYTSSDGKISITTGGKTTDIEVKGNTKVSDFIKSLNDAGVNASFDSTNHRIFVSAKKSGKENDFTLAGMNLSGNEALSKLGLSVGEKAELKIYKDYAKYAKDTNGNSYFELDANGNVKTDKDGNAIVRAGSVYDADKTKAEIEKVKNDIGSASSTITVTNAQIEYAKAYKIVEDASAAGGTWSDPDALAAAQKVLDKYQGTGYNFDDVHDKYTNNILDAYITEQEQKRNDAVKYIEANNLIWNDSGSPEDFESKVQNAAGVLDGSTKLEESNGAKRIYGQDTEIELNGAIFTSANSEITVNGLTINTLNTTKEGESLAINVTNDSQGMYDKIKGFIKEYNEIINELTKMYNADSSKGYEPLTSDEKDAMTDKEIEEWEKKIKDSILRRDDSVSQMMTLMKNAMFKSYTVNGKSYSLSSFGISTISILNATKNEENAFHIDGDSDDMEVSGKTDKLLTALQEDPDTVADFMMQLASGLYDSIGKKMSSSTLSSFGVVYNDKEMAREYSDYTKTISKWEEKLKDIEDSYYKKFAAMESALATLQSQQSSLANLFA